MFITPLENKLLSAPIRVGAANAGLTPFSHLEFLRDLGVSKN